MGRNRTIRRWCFLLASKQGRSFIVPVDGFQRVADRRVRRSGCHRSQKALRRQGRCARAVASRKFANALALVATACEVISIGGAPWPPLISSKVPDRHREAAAFRVRNSVALIAQRLCKFISGSVLKSLDHTSTCAEFSGAEVVYSGLGKSGL